jgi:hypothetical protein
MTWDAIAGLVALFVGSNVIMLGFRRNRRPDDWWTIEDWLARGDEPLRECCRLQALRGWSHVKYIAEVFAGGS